MKQHHSDVLDILLEASEKLRDTKLDYRLSLTILDEEEPFQYISSLKPTFNHRSISVDELENGECRVIKSQDNVYPHNASFNTSNTMISKRVVTVETQTFEDEISVKEFFDTLVPKL